MVEIVPERSAEEVNAKTIAEIREVSESQQKVSTPNVQALIESKTDTKIGFKRLLDLEATHSKTAARYSGISPIEVVDRFKKRMTSINERLDNIKKKTKANNKLQDVVLMKEEVQVLSSGHPKFNVFHTDSNLAKRESMLDILHHAFGPHSKVTLELYPNARPNDQVEKEKGQADNLAKRLTLIENSRLSKRYSFFKDGYTLPEALAFVKKVAGKLNSSTYLKELGVKIDRNMLLLDSAKSAMISDEKIGDEEKAVITKISDAWKFFQFALEHKKSVHNGLLFFNVMATIQKQLESFGADAASFDTMAKGLAEQSKAVTDKINQNKGQLQANFVGEIVKELEEIEKKARSLNK